MKRKDNRKRTFIIGAIIIAFFVSLPFLYKALLYGAAYVYGDSWPILSATSP